jgi:hypothetical protein
MGSGYIAPPFLTAALDGGEWPAPRPGRFIPGAHWIEGAGLDVMEKREIPSAGNQTPDFFN